MYFPNMFTIIPPLRISAVYTLSEYCVQLCQLIETLPNRLNLYVARQVKPCALPSMLALKVKGQRSNIMFTFT